MKRLYFLWVAVATILVIPLSSSCNQSNKTSADAEPGSVSDYSYMVHSCPFEPSLPYSVATEKIPEKNYVVIFFNQQGKVSLCITGNRTANDILLRKRILHEVKRLYTDYSTLSAAISDDNQDYIHQGFVGSPLVKFGKENESDLSGIPYTETVGNSGLTELQIWLKAILSVTDSGYIPGVDSEEYLLSLKQFRDNLKRNNNGIIIVADGNTKYRRMVKLFDNLSDIYLHRVSIVTNGMAVNMQGNKAMNCELDPSNHFLTPYIVFQSSFEPEIVEDCNYINDNLYSSVAPNVTTGHNIAIAPASTYKSIANDGGYDDEEDTDVYDGAVLDELEEEEIEEHLDILHTEKVFDLQIPYSRAVALEIGGNFPFDGWGNVTNMMSGDSSGHIPLIENNQSGTTVLESLARYNMYVVKENESLIARLRSDEISVDKYHELKEQLLRQADADGYSPIVIIHPSYDATLSTVMAAMSTLNIVNITRYDIVAQ